MTSERTISLAKYGAFPANRLIGRPYNLTYEILDKVKDCPTSELRIVPASEIHADTIAEEIAAEAGDKVVSGVGDGVTFELVGEEGEVVMRSNRETIDDAARQTLSMEEIEELKREGTDAGKALIAKLMLSHTALDEKTAFSLAKYKLLKTKKYLRQFTLLPLDVANLTNWLIEDKDPSRIMEMREEMLALLGCWGNVHYSGPPLPDTVAPEGGRWLVVDEVGGLLVAAMAERMGILYPENMDTPKSTIPAVEPSTDSTQTQETKPQSAKHHLPEPDLESYPTSNTITLLHANAQPNLSLLKYFDFLPDTPSPTHPLTPHLRTLSWLQLLAPEEDMTYSTPAPNATPEEIQSWRSGKRGTYYRKRRRHMRTQQIVHETREGQFSGLLIASSMSSISVLKHLIPLLAGGAPVVIYSPTIEPLAEVADLYSTSRRTAFITAPPEEDDLINWAGNEDFPLNPTLLLGVGMQTSKVRHWQVLPGRTHPLMTGRGGAEGYIFTGTRVIPAIGKVEARGKWKKRKTDATRNGDQPHAEQTAPLEEDKPDSVTIAADDAVMEDIKTEPA